MKKSLSAIGALMCALTALASAPTADELANMTLGINRWGETSIGSNTIGIAPSSSVEGMWEISNFDRKIDYSTVKMSIADDGSISIAPQMVGSDYDYDTYESIYYMLVPAESTEKAPMEFTNDRITGTYADGVITLDEWNIVKVNSSFSSNLGTLYSQNVNTLMMAPNTTVAMGIWDINLSDEWDFLGWNKIDVSEGEKLAAAQQNELQLDVYNFDEVGACMTLTLDFDAMTATYTTGDVVFRTSGSTPRDYVLAKISPRIMAEDEEVLDGPVVGTISEDLTTITFNDLATVRTDHPSLGWSDHGAPMHTLILTLDEPLENPEVTAITDVRASEAQVANVKYVDMSGRVSNHAFDGVNIVVTTYTDGTTSTSKVVK